MPDRMPDRMPDSKSPWASEATASPRLLERAWEMYSSEVLHLNPEDLEFALAKEIFFSGIVAYECLQEEQNHLIRNVARALMAEEIRQWLANRQAYHQDLTARLDAEAKAKEGIKRVVEEMQRRDFGGNSCG